MTSCSSYLNVYRNFLHFYYEVYAQCMESVLLLFRSIMYRNFSLDYNVSLCKPSIAHNEPFNDLLEFVLSAQSTKIHQVHHQVLRI